MKNRIGHDRKLFGQLRTAALLLTGAMLACLVLLPAGRPVQAAEHYTVQFAPSADYSVIDVSGAVVTSMEIIPGDDAVFALRYPNKAAASGQPEGYTWHEALSACVLRDTSGAVTEWSNADIGYVEHNGTQYARLPVTGSGTISFRLDFSSFVPLIGVVEKKTAGYWLRTERGVRPGQAGGQLEAVLTVYPPYELREGIGTQGRVEIGQLLSLPEGYGGSVSIRPGSGDSERAVDYACTITYTADRTGAFPADLTGPLNIAVIGVRSRGGDTPAEPVPGGASEDTARPAIRVENQVNLPGLSSDTVLWPANTREDGAVSCTTITDAELDALIELVRAHGTDAASMEGDGYREAIIQIQDKRRTGSGRPAPGAYRLDFTQRQFQKLAELDLDRLSMVTPAGQFSLYGDAIRQAAGAEDRVALRLQRLDYEGRPGLEVELILGEEYVSRFDQPYGARIFVPYELAKDEDPNAIVMEYIHGDGTRELVTECYYDAEAKGVYFFSSHLSKFGVSYRPAAFKDVSPKHWAAPYVTFLASRGVVGGADGKFRPDAPATRAEFIHTLASCLSAAQLPRQPIQVYRDIPAGHFAARAADWVFFNNLDGAMIQGDSFRPNEAISRQDAATLLSNAASGSNLRIRSRGRASDYQDLNTIAAYALEPVERLSRAGILSMNASHRFFPTKSMNRGEMAQIIAVFLSSL